MFTNVALKNYSLHLTYVRTLPCKVMRAKTVTKHKVTSPCC